MSLDNVVDAKIGLRIRAERLKKGMTQQALANSIGVSIGLIDEWEVGRMRVDANRLLAVAFVLDLRVGKFFENLGEINSMENDSYHNKSDISEGKRNSKLDM